MELMVLDLQLHVQHILTHVGMHIDKNRVRYVYIYI